jgi:hypothetical protein
MDGRSTHASGTSRAAYRQRMGALKVQVVAKLADGVDAEGFREQFCLAFADALQGADGQVENGFARGTLKSLVNQVLYKGIHRGFSVESDHPDLA